MRYPTATRDDLFSQGRWTRRHYALPDGLPLCQERPHDALSWLTGEGRVTCKHCLARLEVIEGHDTETYHKHKRARGGLVTLARYGRGHFSRIGKRGGNAWKARYGNARVGGQEWRKAHGY